MARYRKGEKINSGGFGVVYQAVRVEDEQVFAYKELPKGADDNDKKRFSREVRIQANLDHENIVQIIGSNLSIDAPFFVMPLAEGNLREKLIEIRRDKERIAGIFRQILKGLAYAHKKGIVHRDLKPENILFFLDFEDWIKISDFGLGKRLDFESLTITRSHETMGTAAYMPPEQYTNFKSVDTRGDIFSLGKILYEMLTGELPIHVNINHPEIQGSYGYIIGKCLEHSPEKRYQTVKELLDDFNLLTQSPEEFEKPIEEAERLLEILSDNQDEQSLKALDALLRNNSNDQTFCKEVLTRLPRNVIIFYQSKFAHRFYERLRNFDSFLDSSLAFEFTDKVANFYKVIYSLDIPDEIKKLILTRLLVMGRNHNRFHVREVLCSILALAQNESDALLARDVIKYYKDEGAWCAEVCVLSTLAPVVARALEDCKSKDKP